MAKINRVNGNVQAFASAALGTERTVFGDVTQSNDLTAQFTADFLRGWGIVGPSDQPALEDFNAAMYTHGQMLAYLHQMGVAEYNAAQEYPIGGMCNVGGVIYVSLVNANIGNTPASSPAQWSNPNEIATQPEAVAGTDNVKSMTSLRVAQSIAARVVQATTSIQGIVELATNAEMATGTDTARVPSVAAVMSLFSKRAFNSTDYIRIPDVPGGFLLQWGAVITGGSGVTATFATPFGTVLNAVTSALQTADVNTTYQSPTINSMFVQAYNQAGGLISGTNVRYIAIGIAP